MPSCAKCSQLAGTKQLVSLDKLPPAPGQTGNKPWGLAGNWLCGQWEERWGRGRQGGEENSLERAGSNSTRRDVKWLYEDVGEVKETGGGRVERKKHWSTKREIKRLSEESRGIKRDRNNRLMGEMRYSWNYVKRITVQLRFGFLEKVWIPKLYIPQHEQRIWGCLFLQINCMMILIFQANNCFVISLNIANVFS